MKIKTEKWLLAEAQWRTHEQRPDGLTNLGYPEVSWQIGSLLFTIHLHWHDLPQQVRDEAMKTCHRITNYEPPTPEVHRR